MFEDAIEQAKVLDREFKTTGKLQGPLHGTPVTFKDQFNVKGVDTTLGYVGRSFNPAHQDAVLVQMLKSMGAVIIAKTNLSQSIMVCICHGLYDIDWLTATSGQRRRTIFGDSPQMLETPCSRRVARLEVKAHCWPCTALSSGSVRISEGVFVSHRAWPGCMASSPV